MTNDKIREDFEALEYKGVSYQKDDKGYYCNVDSRIAWAHYLAGIKRGEAEIESVLRSYIKPYREKVDEQNEQLTRLKAEIEKTIIDVSTNCRNSYIEEITQLKKQIETDKLQADYQLSCAQTVGIGYGKVIDRQEKEIINFRQLIKIAVPWVGNAKTITPRAVEAIEQWQKQAEGVLK